MTDQRSAVPTAARVDVHLDATELPAALAADARAGLAMDPKRLSPMWLYDDRGSELFDAITALPEYYPTRTERSILAAHADEIAALTEADTFIELGSGTSAKTRLLLDALVRAGTLGRIVPFDVSETTLRDAARDLLADYPDVGVHAVVGDFHRHLDLLPGGGRRLVAFLGSTIGNLLPDERARLLRAIAADMCDGDALVLGTDLVKDPVRLEAAYDDSAGVTARFTANALTHLNRVLGGDADPAQFTPEARWVPLDDWIELGLRSRVDQVVRLDALGLDVAFRAGELLRTEVSTKFRRAGVEDELCRAGLRLERWWTDGSGDFAVSLARRDC